MKKFSLILSALLVGAVLVAQEVTLTQDDKTVKKKNADSISKGFEYYDGTNVEEDKNGNLILKYLKEISDENKKQTKIQEDILKILKATLDPEPKMIKKEDGTECIANSTSDCFDYAALIENNPEVKKIPAMKEFLSNPYDLKKVVEYQKWQAELFKHAFNTGNSIQLAQEEFGDKAFPLGLNRTAYNNTTGLAESTLVPEIKKRYLDEIKDKFTVNIFIGFNVNLDLMAIPGITDVIASNPTLNYKIYFADEKTKDIFESALDSIYSKDRVFSNVKMELDVKDMFKTYNIYTTPSFVMDYKISEETIKSQTIHTGNITNDVFIARAFNNLEFLKVIDYKKLSDTSYWNTEKGDTARKDFFINKFGINIGPKDSSNDKK